MALNLSPYVDDSIRVHQTNTSYEASGARRGMGLSNLSSPQLASQGTETSKASTHEASDSDQTQIVVKQTVESNRTCETTSSNALQLNDSGKTLYDPTSICDSTQRQSVIQLDEQLKRCVDFNKISLPTKSKQHCTNSLQQQYYISNGEPPVKVQVVSMIESQPETKLTTQSETCGDQMVDNNAISLQQGCQDKFYQGKTASKEHSEHVTLIYPQSDPSTQELSFVTTDSSDAFLRHKNEESNLSNETVDQSTSSRAKENTTQQTYHELTPVSYVTTQFAPHAFTSTPLGDNNQSCQSNSESYSNYLDTDTQDKQKSVSGIANTMDPTFYYQQKQESVLCNAQETQTELLNAEAVANQQIYYVTSTEKNEHFYTRNEQADDKDTGSGTMEDNSTPDSSGSSVQKSTVSDTWKLQVTPDAKPLISQATKDLINKWSHAYNPGQYNGTPHPGIADKYLVPVVHSVGSNVVSKYIGNTDGQENGRSQHEHLYLQYPASTAGQSNGFSGTSLGMSNISNLSLNSTGSEEHLSTTPNESSPDTSGNPPYNTPVKGFAMSTPVIPSATQLNAALFQVKNDSVSESDYDLGRHAHNAKERARRARIKISCEKLRELVPGITLKTDKATVFEFAVEYLAFLKRLVGPQYDKDFLKQCSPY